MLRNASTPLHCNQPLSTLTVAVAYLFVAHNASFAQPTRPAIRTVVHSDLTVAGLPQDLRYSSAGVNHYYALGGLEPVFAADITGAPVTHAIFQQNAGGQTNLIAEIGDPAPGLLAGTVFSEEFHYLAPNTVGGVAFTGQTAGAVPGRGVWAYRNGDLDVIAATGLPAPGMGGKVFQTAELASMNDAGHVAVSAWIPRASQFAQATHGIWSEGAGNGLQLLAAQGLAAPTIPGATFGVLAHPLINQNGQTTFYASLEVASPPYSRDSVWTGSDYSDIRPVVTERDPYPAVPGGYFSYVGLYPQIDSAGSVYFTASVYSQSTGFLGGIWKATNAGLQELIREDTILPYAHNPAIYFTSIGYPAVSDDGTIAFAANIEGPGVHYSDSNDGVWRRTPDGAVSLVLREGDVPPGWDPNEKIQFLLSVEPGINNRGQVVISGHFYRPGQDPYVGHAIFATDLAGQLQTLVRTGDVIDVDNGPGVDLRTISGVGFHSFGGNNGGFVGNFNDRGEVLFQARFTDGTQGMFISSLVAIPEPKAAALFALAVAVLGLKRCYRSA